MQCLIFPNTCKTKMPRSGFMHPLHRAYLTLSASGNAGPVTFTCWFINYHCYYGDVNF